MSEINVPSQQRDAITALDVGVVRKLVEQSLREERLVGLSDLRLYACGDYIGEKLRIFQQAVLGHAAAKAPKKRVQTEMDVRRAGGALVSAVEQMQGRVERERREDELFVVSDYVGHPFLLDNQLSVSVSYRWRRQVTDPWEISSITFTHTHHFAPSYVSPQPKRKLSAAAKARVEDGELYKVWEHLAGLARYDVKRYFQQGGDGSKIPEEFVAKKDKYSGGLNNFSTVFWHEEP